MQIQVLTFIAAAAAIANAQSIQFPAVCQSDCTPFGTSLMTSCMTTPTSTDVSVTALKIATCFCNQYGSGGGVTCANCIGNAPTLSDKNSTTLFKKLVADCAGDPSGATAAITIAPIIKDAVLQNVAVATSTGSAKATVVAGAVTSTKSSAGVNGVSMLAVGAAVVVALL